MERVNLSMHDRYDDRKIARLWSDEALLDGWEKVELAVLQARVNLSEMDAATLETIQQTFASNRPDVTWWKQKDAEIRHDLNAFVFERQRHLPDALQHFVHDEMTSFDTEESALLEKLLLSVAVIEALLDQFEQVLRAKALKYRHTPMMAVTHGQFAEVESFGKRIASWYRLLIEARTALNESKAHLRFSKLSGAVGTYAEISPELEAEALKLLGFEPYYGATQILHRTLFRPMISALGGVASAIGQVAMDVRLGARSASCIYQEPFGKKQTGSSAMPGKKNTIIFEQEEGLWAYINGCILALHAVEVTWEERAIAQSCVERTALRDLFHATARMLSNAIKAIDGLSVYPVNMMTEIVKTNGTYAAASAKSKLAKMAAPFGLDAQSCYRIVQCAAFMLGSPVHDKNLPGSLKEADQLLGHMQELPLEPEPRGNIRDIIAKGLLRPVDSLDISAEQIENWNTVLHDIFADKDQLHSWDQVFTLTHLLRNEHVIFEQLFGA